VDGDGPRLAAAWFLFERKRHADALAKAGEALSADPASLEAHYLAGLCHACLERRAEAETHARAVLRLAPEAPQGHELVAIAGWDRDRRRAEQGLREALRLDPQNAMRYAMLGRFLGDLGRLEEGITVAIKGRKLAPENLGVLRTLQTLYRLNEEPELAQEMAERALKLDPEDADVHLEAGLRLLDRGDTRAAHGSFLQSLRIAPADGSTHEAIAHERVRTHRLFRNAWLLPVTPGGLTFTLLTPLFWYGLSRLFSPLRYIALAAVVFIVFSYTQRAAFRLCRAWVLRRIKAGKL
jgi:tetratricopeptide (TPR) repeat protein